MKSAVKRVVSLFADRHGFLQGYVRASIPRAYYRRLFSRRVRSNPTISSYVLSPDAHEQIGDFWNRELGVTVFADWHKAYYATNGVMDPRYVPEDVFYKLVEPLLNRYDLAKAYQDKNQYNRLFPGFRTPETIVRNISGSFYSDDYSYLTALEAADLVVASLTHKLVIKPAIDSGGGRNIEFLDLASERNSTADCIRGLFSRYKRDFIIQNYINQHPDLRELHPNSLNTARIMTLRYKGSIRVLSRLVRMGNNGSLVDNSTLGGVSCGYNCQGIMNDFATEHFTFIRHTVHPYTGIAFGGRTVPSYMAVDALVVALHERLPHFDIASWDIAIDQGGHPVLVEVNLKAQDVNFHQRNNGPLFGDITSDVIRQCQAISRGEF